MGSPSILVQAQPSKDLQVMETQRFRTENPESASPRSVRSKQPA
jgi:hypothetical protein